MGERIAVAMSGGVDSSVAAWLLQREGHELMGVTLRLFDRETPEGTCGASDDLADARAVAERLGMPHQVLDCRTCFRERVIRPFAAAYEAGCTPNPCVDCNRGIKFGELLRRSLELGAEAVATGHYVRMERDGATGRCLLKKALHPEKDQSYVLYSLTQEQLSRSRFPLGGLSKAGLRQRGEEGEPGYLLHPRRGLCRFPPPVHGEGVPSGALPGSERQASGNP